MTKLSRLLGGAAPGVLALVLATACGTPRVEQPLFDALHPPRLYTESAQLDWPASRDPNRYISGWWDYARRGAPRLAAFRNARVQGVKLGDGPKILRLNADVKESATPTFEARVSGGPWQSYPLEPKIRIPIPPEQRVGRFTVDLKFQQDHEVGVRKAELSDPRPAGEIQHEPSVLVQSGFSLVETVRRLDSRTSLSGRFRPPSAPAEGQSFALEIERSDGSRETVLEWSSERAGAGDFEVELGDRDEWARLRFLALGTGPPGRWSELTVTSGLQPEPESVAAPAQPRIVILYIMDALRRDHVGHLGGPDGITPTIDRLASEGVTFREHFSVAPNTVPSMKSLLTGQVFLFKGGHKLTPESGPTLAERYRDAGFRTGLFSGNGNVTPWRGMARGFEKVSNGVLWKGDDDRAAAGYNNNAERIHAVALDWIDQQESDDRLFVHIQTIHPHNPYSPPEPFLSRFVPENGSEIDGRTPTLLGIRRGRVETNEADRERLRGLYAASVAYNDAYIEEFLAGVLERYSEREVLFILTSDHGEELFEHGGVLHGYTLYDEMLAIPLVAWWPGTIEPGEVEAPTDTLDLYSSLARLATQGDPITGGGDSLWGDLLGERPERPHGDDLVFSSASAVHGGIFMARSPRFKYVYAPRMSSRGGDRWGMGQGLGRGYDGEYLFDLEQDPREMVNRAGDDNLEADWLSTRLMSWIEAGKAIEAGTALDEMDEETRKSLRALGYLQ